MGTYGGCTTFGITTWFSGSLDFAYQLQITMEDLQVVEHIVRVDPKVIEQCQIIGIPKDDMHKVYCDRMWKSSEHSVWF